MQAGIVVWGKQRRSAALGWIEKKEAVRAKMICSRIFFEFVFILKPYFYWETLVQNAQPKDLNLIIMRYINTK